MSVVTEINVGLERSWPTYYLHLPKVKRYTKRQGMNVQGVMVSGEFESNEFRDNFWRTMQTLYPGWSVQGWVFINEHPNGTPSVPARK